MPDQALIARYNYDEFVPEKFGPWMRFDDSPPLGEVAPDFPLWTITGEETSLSAGLVAAHVYDCRVWQLYLTILQDGGAIHECHCRPLSGQRRRLDFPLHARGTPRRALSSSHLDDPVNGTRRRAP